MVIYRICCRWIVNIEHTEQSSCRTFVGAFFDIMPKGWHTIFWINIFYRPLNKLKSICDNTSDISAMFGSLVFLSKIAVWTLKLVANMKKSTGLIKKPLKEKFRLVIWIHSKGRSNYLSISRGLWALLNCCLPSSLFYSKAQRIISNMA